MRTLTAPDFATLRESLAGEIVRLRADDGIRPISVVVPGDLAREETRRDLAGRLGGLFAIEVRTLRQWVGEAAAFPIAAEAGVHLTECGFERLVARVLEDGAHRRGSRSPGAVTAFARSRGVAAQVASSIQTLMQGRISPDAFRRAASGGPRAELAETHERVLEALSSERLHDRRREEAVASRRLEREERAADVPLLVFGFHDLTALQRQLVASAARLRPVTVLIPGPGGAGEAAAESLLGWTRAFGADLQVEARAEPPLLTIEESLFESPALTDPGDDALELWTCASESSEVREIARAILREVDEGDRSFDEFLVTATKAGPDPRLFRRIFEKAGIPLVDRAGIVATRTRSARRALALARALSTRGGVAEADALEFLAPRDEEEELESVYDDPAAQFARARDWREAVERFAALHELRFGAPPEEEVAEALHSIALVLGERPNRPRDFASTLEAALTTQIRRTRLEAGSHEAAVLLVSMDAARGLRRPFVFHAGLVEGAVRRTIRQDPWLPDALREAINLEHEHEGRLLPLRRSAREENLLLARFAFECSTERAVLSWARRQRVGGETRNPSGLLLELASRRGGEALTSATPSFHRVAPAPSRSAAIARPVDRLDLEIAILEGDRGPDAFALLLEGGAAPDLLRALEASRQRWRPGTLTSHDGVLGDEELVGEVARRLDGFEAWSATALETLANCPFAFLVERVLGLRPRREETDDYDAMSRGTLLHEILETIYEVLRRESALPLEPRALPGALALLDELVGHLRGELASEPPAARATREATLAALRNDVAMVIARDAHRAPSERTTPLYFEFAFGNGAPSAASPSFPLGGARFLALRGKADRVDLREDGRLEIVDWKSGAARMKNGALTSFREGKTEVRLQLPLYLEAVERALGRETARAIYYHATAAHGFREIEFSRRDLEAKRDAISGLLEHLLELGRRGWFPCTPGDSCCRGDLSPACGPSVAARTRRKRSDPGLERHRLALRSLRGEERE